MGIQESDVSSLQVDRVIRDLAKSIASDVSFELLRSELVLE